MSQIKPLFICCLASFLKYIYQIPLRSSGRLYHPYILSHILIESFRKLMNFEAQLPGHADSSPVYQVFHLEANSLFYSNSIINELFNNNSII